MTATTHAAGAAPTSGAALPRYPRSTTVRTPAHHQAERNSSLALVGFIVACLIGIAWAFYTGAQQVQSLVRCEQLVANADPADDCPQPVGTVAP